MAINVTEIGGPSVADRGQKLSFGEKKNAQDKLFAKNNQILIGSGIGLAAFAYALRNGFKTGLERIGYAGRWISSLFAIPATLLFPITTAYGEYEEYKGSTGQDSGQRLIQIIYPMLSAAFAPMTLSEPLEKGMQSKPHTIATIANLPHIVYTFFSYTCARVLTLLTSLKMIAKKDSPSETFRLEQLRDVLSKLGNIGSDHAAVTPGAQQCITGLQAISDIFKGDFGSLKERIRTAPTTTLLGMFFNSAFWIPTFIGKTLDSPVRTAEMVDQFKNAFPKDSLPVRLLEKFRDYWHNTSKENSLSGKFLNVGREFAKIMQTIASPLCMVAVVFPVFDKFTKGLGNKEAQEIGGPIAFIDKAFNIGALVGHLYFTLLYGLTIRLPQTITTASFYVCNLLNKARGILDDPEHPKYIEPNDIKDKIFNPNKGWVKSISDFASRILDKIELQLHPKNPTLVNDLKNEKGEIVIKGTGKTRLIENIYKVIAQEECYTPIREKYYIEEVKKRNGVKPSPEEWAKFLEDNKDEIIEEAKIRFIEDYLQKSTSFTEEERQEYFFGKYNIYDLINSEVITLVENEINAGRSLSLSASQTEQRKEVEGAPKKIKLKSSSFNELITKPFKFFSDILELLHFRTFIAKFVVLPLNILNFVESVDFGKHGMPNTLRNWLVQESSIRIGNNRIGCEGELPPVALYAWQTIGLGLANLYNLFKSPLKSLSMHET